MDNEQLCRFLEWDSRFFGFRIARCQANRLTPANISRIEEWCEQQQVQCLYFLADSSDPATGNLAARHGFRFVDIRLTLERDLGDRPSRAGMAPPIHLSKKEDVDDLAAIARSSHTDSRFYFDTRFPRERCDTLYDTWLRKSCLEGYANAVLVAEQDLRPVGYISCTVTDGVGQIGLIGVADSARGRGHGSRLVRSALAWFEQNQASRIRVVTQGRNVQAQRLYQHCGFITASVELWHHRWLDER